MTTAIGTYDRVASEGASTVIGRYSTSFALATRLLGARPRPHIRAVYALVRVADEVVDGAAAEAGAAPETVRRILDELEAETLAALSRGFSANLVVHAFARTARECDIGAELIRPFFAAMRTDLEVTSHDAASHDAYVYGSAEVVGLMCLQVFLGAGGIRPPAPPAHVISAARRLGAAFQDLNFLRDRAADADLLGRDYVGHETRRSVLERVEGDLAAAAIAIDDLPADCRRAVRTAHALFSALARRLETAPPGAGRVRVPALQKALITARASLAAPRRARA